MKQNIIRNIQDGLTTAFIDGEYDKDSGGNRVDSRYTSARRYL